MYDQSATVPAPVPPAGRKSRRVLIVGLVIVALCFLVCTGLFALGAASDHKTTSSTAHGALAATTAQHATTYATLTDREWRLLAKNPDAYAGNGFVVYGVVTQADAATGTEAFLAHAGGLPQTDPFAYLTNAMFTGPAPVLAKLVEGDEFMAHVTVHGSYSYDTQAGGNTTAPRLQVDAIAITTPAPGDRP